MNIIERLKLLSVPVQVMQSQDGTIWAKWYRGTLYIIKQDTKVTCQICRGRGIISGSIHGNRIDCPACKGVGRREVSEIDWSDKTIWHFFGEGRTPDVHI